MPDFTTRRVVEPSNPPKSVEPPTAEGLLKEMHELIDMLPDDMLEKAVEGILNVPDFPEDFDPTEIERLELARQKYHTGELTRPDKSETVNWSPKEREASSHPIRDNLHLLADYMSGEILDEAVDVLGSTALLDIPYEPTEEEWESIRAGIEEAEAGDLVPWEQVRCTGV